MTRKISAVIATFGLAAAMTITTIAPSQALVATVGAKSCTVTATTTSTSIVATNKTCGSVQAGIKYYQGAYGLPYTAYGTKSTGTSKATSPSLIVVSRFINVWIASSSAPVYV